MTDIHMEGVLQVMGITDGVVAQGRRDEDEEERKRVRVCSVAIDSKNV